MRFQFYSKKCNVVFLVKTCLWSATHEGVIVPCPTKLGWTTQFLWVFKNLGLVTSGSSHSMSQIRVTICPPKNLSIINFFRKIQCARYHLRKIISKSSKLDPLFLFPYFSSHRRISVSKSLRILSQRRTPLLSLPSLVDLA